MPGAEEYLEEASVAEGPNEGMNPNADMVSNAEAEGRAVSVSPKPGEKRSWDATGGVDRELEVTVLRVLQRHGCQPSTSTSGRMVDQGSQTHLSGEVLQAARRPLNKIKGDPSASSLCGGSGYEQKGADSFEAAPTADYAMGEEEILQMEAERLRQLSEEADEMRQASEMNGFQKGEHLIQACDGTTWECHFHEDGRQYYYCLDTQGSKWTLPDVGDKMGSDEVVGSPSGNELEMETALGPSSSTPTPESTRALQGSVSSLVEKDFSSTVGDSGLRGGKAAETSGSPREDRISGIQKDMAGGHLDQKRSKALSEGDAAVKSVDPENKIPNAEVNAVSVTQEQIVDEVSGSQEVSPGDEDDGENRLRVTTEEVSPFGAMGFTTRKEASGIAGDAGILPKKGDEAWSANEARANVPDSTWSAEEARGEAQDGTCSAVDCNNGAQVTVVADDGGASADALMHSEVGGEEQGLLSRAGANVAAAANGGDDSPLETMEPQEPAVEENAPAVDDQSKNPAVEENLPAADDSAKDSNGGSSSKKEDMLPIGSSPEVDTVQTATDEAEPLAKKEDGPESLERKVDDLVGLVQEKDKQLDPKVETRDVPGAEETVPVSEEPIKEVPKEGALVTPGKHCYQEGDVITGLVSYINVHGAFLDHGDMKVLIPAEGDDTPLFKIGDTVNAAVKRVEEDGTVISDTYLILEEDVEDSSSTLRKWKDSGWGKWWTDSWYAGQWDQNFSDGQWDWKTEDWQCYEWSAGQWISQEEWDEAVQKQLCGERICKVLLENWKEEKEYVGKITGTLLDRRLDDVRELVADLALLENEARAAYNMLLNVGWTPSGEEVAGGEKMKFPRNQCHNALYDLARRRRPFSAAVIGEAIEKMLNKGDNELWSELWLDSKKFLQELDKCKKVHMTPKPVSKGYTKLCKFYNQGRCRNGDDCPFERRRHGEGWPERGPAESETSHNTGDDDGDIGGPPTDEGAVDEVQQEREDSAFRTQYNFGKGASKGEPTVVEPKEQLCLYYGVNRDGCKYGTACRYIHDDKAVLEGTWEQGKSWDNASRKAVRDEGFHNSCYDYYVKGKCRVRYGVCKFSHEELSTERLARLRYLVNVANQVKFQKERGLEIPDRNTFKPPTIGGAESSSSSAPQAQEGGVVGTLDEADGDVQKDSVAQSTTVPLHDPEEPIENWMARNQHLWVYTPHVSEVMITLGVTNVKELQEYIFVEDLVEKGITKVTACKILNLVGGVRYRPMSPDVAVSSNASVRVEHSSGSREAGRDAARTIFSGARS